jgi:hypothetical protein
MYRPHTERAVDGGATGTSPAGDRAITPATMMGLLLFVAVVLGGVLALSVVAA